MHILKIGRFIVFVGISLIFISACSSSRESSAPDGGSSPIAALPQDSSPTLAAIPASQAAEVKAGDIDDNARWDTYLNYRDTFLGQYGSSVRNVDVSGRRIITVTDAEGLPVEGATVLVFAGETLVSETQTYADGKTLFMLVADWRLGDGFEDNIRRLTTGPRTGKILTAPAPAPRAGWP